MNKLKPVVRQSGAIAVKPGTTPMILMVKAKKNPSHWIFPKGHIERGETAENAAVRELLEESGIKGKVICQAGKCEYLLKNIHYEVVYFLCEYVSTEGLCEPGRSPCWKTVEEAYRLLSFPDSRKLLSNIIPNISIC